MAENCLVVNVFMVLLVKHTHNDGQHQAEYGNDGINAESLPFKQAVEPQHGEYAEVFIEILHGNGAASPHQQVSTVLQ